MLAVGALLLGADCAAGTDVDRLAVRAARQNAELNGVGPRLATALCSASGELADVGDVVVGGGGGAAAALEGRRFDVTVANILQARLEFCFLGGGRCRPAPTRSPCHAVRPVALPPSWPPPQFSAPGPPAGPGLPPGGCHRPRRAARPLRHPAGKRAPLLQACHPTLAAAGAGRGGRLPPPTLGCTACCPVWRPHP